MSGPERYAVVPAVLPPELPAINRKQAVKVRDAIVRKFFAPAGRYQLQWSWDRSTGNAWCSSKPTRSTNHSKGLGRLIHDMSHALFEHVYPDRRAHDPLHVRYEQDVAAFVAARLPRLFPEPKPKTPRPTLDEKRRRDLIRTEDAIVRWTSKAKRAATALRKLRIKQRRLIRLTGAKP